MKIKQVIEGLSVDETAYGDARLAAIQKNRTDRLNQIQKNRDDRKAELQKSRDERSSKNRNVTERDVDSNFELTPQQRAASKMAQKLKRRIDMSDKDGQMLNDVDYVQLSRLAELLNKMGSGAYEFSTVKDVYDEMVLNTKIRNKGTDDDGVPFNKKSKDHEPEMTPDRFKELLAMAK